MSPTAVEARRRRLPEEGGVSDDMGTAVVIQEMVFGNRDDRNCLSGVLFTRDQRTGANEPHIEWTPKVQCDKIVSGKLRKPLLHTPELRERFPAIHERLLTVKEVFEARAKRPPGYRIHGGKPQTLSPSAPTPLRMTSSAALRSMWDFVDEGKTSIQLASMIINTALEQMGKVLAIRSEEESFFSQGALSNKPLFGAVVLTFALQLATIYVPFLNPAFKTEPLSAAELAATILLSAVVFLAVEGEKAVKRSQKRAHNAHHSDHAGSQR